MNENLGHSQRVSYETSVLAAGTAEAIEAVTRHVVSALDRNLLDRVGHILDRNLDEAIGNLFAPPAGADLVG
jgi:hypothetical protein